jgi:integrase
LWEGCISLGKGADGKRRRKKVYAHTKAEVLKKLDEFRRKATSRMLTEADKQTTVAFLEWWLTNVAKKETAPTTWERYEQLVRLHAAPNLGQVILFDLSELDIEQFYADMEAAGSSTWNRKMAGTLLGNALNYAVRKKLIPYNPAGDIKKPRPEHYEIKPFTDDEARRFLLAARPHRLNGLFALALGTGMRQGEILGLPWCNLDLDIGTVTVQRSLAQTKNGFKLKQPKSEQSRRTIRLPRFVVEALIEHRERMRAEVHPVEGDA